MGSPVEAKSIMPLILAQRGPEHQAWSRRHPRVSRLGRSGFIFGGAGGLAAAANAPSVR